VLRESGVPVTEFRAPAIMGSGSLSFEIIRYLTERLPVMICPRWLYTRAQPIAVRNVLDYLLATLDTPESTGLTIENSNGRADAMLHWITRVPRMDQGPRARDPRATVLG
jgi:uncharacterized protein YbjT (DUF2867 family)